MIDSLPARYDDQSHQYLTHEQQTVPAQCVLNSPSF
jgi:hypothetical protein